MSVQIPSKFAKKFEKIQERAWKLPDKLWEVFWGDILEAMEKRLEILEGYKE